MIVKNERILREYFWWDTYNGLNFSSTSLYRVTIFGIFVFYYVTHYINYKHPKTHPNYVDFKESVMRIKSK